jgi:hypothetical protein
VSFGVGADLDAGSNSGYQPFVVKFDSSDMVQWARAYVDPTAMSTFNPSSVAIDKTGDVLLTGAYTGTVDFGKGPLSTPTNAYDAFLVKLDAQGTTRWSRKFETESLNYFFPVALALTAADEPVLAGLTDSTIDFGTGPLATAGSADVFVAKFAP